MAPTPPEAPADAHRLAELDRDADDRCTHLDAHLPPGRATSPGTAMEDGDSRR